MDPVPQPTAMPVNYTIETTMVIETTNMETSQTPQQQGSSGCKLLTFKIYVLVGICMIFGVVVV